MRKNTFFTAPILVLALVSVLWPTARPDVERLGDSVYETIWLWRIPAYANDPAWRVRWTWTDPFRAQARCCRALQGENLRNPPLAGGTPSRLAG